MAMLVFGLALMVVFVPMALGGVDLPYSWTEGAIFAGALLLLLGWSARPRPWLFAALIVIGTLNRETAAILVVWFWFVVALPSQDWRQWARAASYGCLWLVLFVGLRVFIPPSSWELYTREHLWSWNMRQLPLTLAVWAAFSFWPYFMWKGRRQAPALFQQTRWGAYLYLAMFLIFGYWSEIRVVAPVIPVLIGVGMAALPLDHRLSQADLQTYEAPSMETLNIHKESGKRL